MTLPSRLPASWGKLRAGRNVANPQHGMQGIGGGKLRGLRGARQTEAIAGWGRLCPRRELLSRHASGRTQACFRMSSHGFCANRFFEMRQIANCEGTIATKKKAAKSLRLNGFLYVVPGAGIEPARLAAGDFESREELRSHAACRPMCSGFFGVLRYRQRRQNRNTF